MTRYAFARPRAALAPLLAAAGIRTATSYVDVGPDAVAVRLGPGFRARLDRAALIRADRYDGTVVSRGVHGWRGRWLVNTAGRGLVRLLLEPAGEARVLGVSVPLRELLVSLEDPTAFVAELAVPTGPAGSGPTRTPTAGGSR